MVSHNLRIYRPHIGSGSEGKTLRITLALGESVSHTPYFGDQRSQCNRSVSCIKLIGHIICMVSVLSIYSRTPSWVGELSNGRDRCCIYIKF